MKKQFKLVSLLLCMALVVSCFSVTGMTISATTDEVLLNADFESYDAENGKFDDWSFFATGDNTRTLSATKGLSGEKAALITSIDNASMAAVEQQFIVDPDKSYRVSVWLKSNGDETGVFDAAGWANGIYLNVHSDDSSVNVVSESIKSVTSWRKVSCIIEADAIPNNVTKLTFSIFMYAVRGRLYIDNASVMEYNGEEEEPQYLYNGGFEDGSGTDVYEWTHDGRTDIFMGEITSDTAYEGTNSLYFNSTNHDMVVNVNQSVKGLSSSNRYLFSCYAKATTTSVQYGGAGLRIGIQYNDSDGAVQNLWSADSFQQAGDWTKIALYFSIPEGATNVKAYVQSNCVKGTYYVDALDIKAIGKIDSFANDSFEVFDEKGFDCWTWDPGNGDAGENTLAQSDSGFDGKAAVISKSNLNNGSSLKQTLDFTTETEKNYIISAYARATYSDNAPWDKRDWGCASLRVTDGTTTLQSDSLTDIGPWKKVSVIVNAGTLSADKNWDIDFYMYGMTGVVYLDNISIAEYTGSQDTVTYEPLYNLGFEEGNGSAFDYWKTTGTTSTVITETKDVHTGDRAVSFYSENINAVNEMYQPIYSFEADTHYLLTAYVKTNGALETAYDGGGAKLKIKYTDSDGAEQTLMTSSVKSADDWTQIRLPFSIPEGGTAPVAVLMIDCVKGTVLFDDLDIAELSFGDINYDMQLNLKDLVRLKKYSAQLTQDIYLPVSDLDSDGGIDAADLSLLRQGLLNGGLENDTVEVWTVDPLTRVYKDSKSNGETSFSLFAAKGEYEAFQLVASTDSNEATVLKNITVSDFVSESGEVIDSIENVSVYREHYVNCKLPSPTSSNIATDYSEEIPDALIPAVSPATGEALGSTARFYAFPYELNNTACQPFYIDVKIPADAKAGDYTAVYILNTNKGLKRGNINLKVWDITLSQTQVQGSYFISRTAANALKVEEAAKNRMFISAIDAQQEEALNEKYGYNNANLRLWSGADNENPTMQEAPSDAKIQERISLHSSKLKLFNYTADEINDYVDVLKDGIISYAKALHKFNVKQLITIPPVEDLLDDGTGNPAVDIWTILPKHYSANIELIGKAREKGCEIWTYNCLAQDKYSPKFLLDYPLINYRIHPGFINYALDVDGFLYWSIDNYGELSDPWTSLNDETEGTVYNGDGILFYPGEDVGLENTFVPSLRAKAIRDGFEDYELCAAAGVDTADVSAIATDFSQWTQDKNVFLNGRTSLGNGHSK